MGDMKTDSLLTSRKRYHLQFMMRLNHKLVLQLLRYEYLKRMNENGYQTIFGWRQLAKNTVKRSTPP